MTDTAVEYARRKREELAERINRAQQELDECRPRLTRIERFLADYAAFAAGREPSDSPSGNIIAEALASRTKSKHNSPKEDVAKKARSLIERAGKPISRTDLYRELVDWGLTIEGGDPEGVMNTMLWRTRDDVGVIHLRNVGYWLKERKWEPASYEPELDSIMGVEDDAPEGIDDNEDVSSG
jgi:hypothetical protein